MKSSRTVVALQIIHTTSPVSSFCAQKSRAGLSITWSDQDTDERSVAKDTARLMSNHKSQALGLSEGEFDELLGRLDYEACWLKLLNLLKRRDYATFEVGLKLKAYGFQDVSIERASDEALKRKFLNDERFARAFVISKMHGGWGKIRIERSLKEKGINIAQYQELLDMLNDESEYQRACEIARRRAIPRTNPEQKLIRYLVGRGFSYPVASSAVRDSVQFDKD